MYDSEKWKLTGWHIKAHVAKTEAAMDAEMHPSLSVLMKGGRWAVLSGN